MYKKTITYTDYYGTERTEDFYFNLTKAEILKMDLSESGGLERYIRRLMAEQDSKKIVQIFEEIILMSYGVKSADGKYFMKEDPIDHHRYSDEFKQTEAYSDLFTKLATDADAAAEFINGISPASANANTSTENSSESNKVVPLPATNAGGVTTSD